MHSQTYVSLWTQRFRHASQLACDSRETVVPDLLMCDQLMQQHAQDLEGTRGCGQGVLKELPEHYPFLDWVRECRAAEERAHSGAAKVVDRGFQTASMRRRNDFLLSVMDDGGGRLDVRHGGGGGGGGRTSFRKGHVAVVHYPHDGPQHIQWEIPAQFASRMVQVRLRACYV